MRRVRRYLARGVVLAALVGVGYVVHLHWIAPARYIGRSGVPVRNDTSQPGGGTVKVTFLGTTTLLFDDGETRLMTDGFITRPNLWHALTGMETDRRRVDTVLDSVLGRAKGKRVDALFVTHSHHDHALDAAYVAQQTGARLYGSPSTVNVGLGGKLGCDRMARLEPGRTMAFGRFRVTAFLSAHSPQKWYLADAGRKILEPLRQPARSRSYYEGGTYDLLIQHGPKRILVKPSANWVPGVLDNVRADVVFLAVAQLGTQDPLFQEAYYEESVRRVEAERVIPMHWDNFFAPLSDDLPTASGLVDDIPRAFDFLRRRTRGEGKRFEVLQGFGSVMLFAPYSPLPPVEWTPPAPAWAASR